jgi:ERCC4-type nuclease
MDVKGVRVPSSDNVIHNLKDVLDTLGIVNVDIRHIVASGIPAPLKRQLKIAVAVKSLEAGDHRVTGNRVVQRR